MVVEFVGEDGGVGGGRGLYMLLLCMVAQSLAYGWLCLLLTCELDRLEGNEYVLELAWFSDFRVFLNRFSQLCIPKWGVGNAMSIR